MNLTEDSSKLPNGIPSLRGQDHTGITVPDLQASIAFFVDVVGCELVTSFGPFRDDTGSFMADALNVHPRAVVEQIALLRFGIGSNIELFQYRAPDQRDAMPKNSDIGGHHIAFYVDDIDAAVAYLKAQGVRVLAGPLPVTEGPAAGQAINYFLAPGACNSNWSAARAAWPTRPARARCSGRQTRPTASRVRFVSSTTVARPAPSRR